MHRSRPPITKTSSGAAQVREYTSLRCLVLRVFARPGNRINSGFLKLRAVRVPGIDTGGRPLGADRMLQSNVNWSEFSSKQDLTTVEAHGVQMLQMLYKSGHNDGVRIIEILDNNKSVR